MGQKAHEEFSRWKDEQQKVIITPAAMDLRDLITIPSTVFPLKSSPKQIIKVKTLYDRELSNISDIKLEDEPRKDLTSKRKRSESSRLSSSSFSEEIVNSH